VSIENPDQVDVDMGRNSFMFPKIKRAFEHAHQLLTAAFAKNIVEDSYLSFVIRSDDAILANRKKRVRNDRGKAFRIKLYNISSDK
jgi:hypothetical protein